MEVTMTKSNVYYMDAHSETPETALAAKLITVFDAAGLDELIKPNDVVAIKVHCGEWNNSAYLRPVYARTLADRIKELGGRPFVCDTTTQTYAPYGSRATELDLLLTHEVVLRKDRTDRRSASGLLLSLIGDRKTLLGLIFGDSTVGDGNLAEEKILFLTHSFVTCIQPRIKGTYERPKSAAKSCLLNRQEKIRRRCRRKAVLYNRPKEACLYAVQPSGSCRLFHSLD